MTTIDQAPHLMQSGHVVGSDGENIGKVGEVYVDDASGQLSWVTVKTGLFGSRESFVPLDDATVNDDTITVPYDKAMIKDAPHAEPGDPLSPEQEDELYRYYNISAGMSTQNTTAEYAAEHIEKTSTVAGAATTGAALKTGRKDPEADGYLTRSEEQLRVGTQKVEAGRARLRKFVVTEQQTVTVPVRHDEVKIVREPLKPGESVDGATIGEDAIEVTLMQDQVKVDKQVVGVEKVKLATETVTEQQQVTDAVRKEQIEVTGDTVDDIATPKKKR